MALRDAIGGNRAQSIPVLTNEKTTIVWLPDRKAQTAARQEAKSEKQTSKQASKQSKVGVGGEVKRTPARGPGGRAVGRSGSLASTQTQMQTQTAPVQKRS